MMNKKTWRTCALAALVGFSVAGPARADLVTFDDINPDIYVGDTPFSSGGFAFTATSLFTPLGGLVGAVDTAGGFFFGVAPTNAVDQFYAGLNDGGLTMTTGNDRALFVDGFDFAFIPAVPGYFLEGDMPGLLVAYYVTFAGATGYEFWNFSTADASGTFAFSTVGAGQLGALAQGMKSVTFFACAASGNICYNPAGNQAQFALDNIYARVPEPGSLGLAVAGLALLAGMARRRKPN